MKRNHTLMTSVVLTVFISGCSVMTPIGKEEFTCPNQNKGGVCAGPRAIYELTNTRANLEDLSGDETFDGYIIETDEKGNTFAKRTHSVAEQGDASKRASSPEQITLENGTRIVVINGERYQYIPRDHAQQTNDNYQTPEVIGKHPALPKDSDPFHQWPNSDEPLAPEPLSVLEPPKVMRILINSYKDNDGNLHLPGYLYVQVEAEKWAFGESSSVRPQRVIPTQIMEKSQEAEAERDYRAKGVSPLEHSER